MSWNVAEQVSKLSEAFELKAGDIIHSGTPENVGPVVKDEVILCKIEGLPDMSIRIVGGAIPVIASQRVGANGSRKCAPDDRLRAAR